MTDQILASAENTAVFREDVHHHHKDLLLRGNSDAAVLPADSLESRNSDSTADCWILTRRLKSTNPSVAVNAMKKKKKCLKTRSRFAFSLCIMTVWVTNYTDSLQHWCIHNRSGVCVC